MKKLLIILTGFLPVATFAQELEGLGTETTSQTAQSGSASMDSDEKGYIDNIKD